MSTNVSCFCLYFILLECLSLWLHGGFLPILLDPTQKFPFSILKLFLIFSTWMWIFSLKLHSIHSSPQAVSQCLYLWMSYVVPPQSWIKWPSRTRPSLGILNFSGTQRHPHTWRYTVGLHHLDFQVCETCFLRDILT